MRKLLSCLLALVLAAALSAPMASAAGYTDIPAGSALAGEVQKAADYGLMNGYNAATFGYGDPMTRAQFVTVLDRMMKWPAPFGEKLSVYITAGMEIPEGISDTYYQAIAHASRYDVIDRSARFRPNDPITRGEMAEMLVRALGLGIAANGLNSNRMVPFSDFNHHTPFTDLPDGNEGYISVAYTIGMTKGITDTAFGPNLTATRAQAAAMLVRIYEKMNADTDFVHGFYAVSSYSQLDLAENMDAVSAGWSRMTWDGETALLSTTSANGNEYNIPSGYQEVTAALEERGVPLNLSVFMDASGGAAELLASEDGRRQAVEQIINELTVSYKTIGKNPYSGVTIDFEGIGSGSRENFVIFLRQLSAQLKDFPDRPLSLYVCVQPVPLGGSVYQNAYDYQSIGALADKVILMAHDYDPRNLDDYVNGPGDTGNYYQNCPTAPLSRIYLDLRDVVELVDPAKVALAFSVRNIAWQIDEDGKLVSGTPVSVAADTVAKRLAQSDTVQGWDKTYQQSYAIYTTEDGSRYFLWYQDGQSVQTALNAAKLLGVTGVSIWRLGNIPLYAAGRGEWSWSGLLHNS